MPSISFDQIPRSIWQCLDWLLDVEDVSPPSIPTMIAAVTHELVFPLAVNWFQQQHNTITKGKTVQSVPPVSAGKWGAIWITSHGRIALEWRAQKNPFNTSPE